MFFANFALENVMIIQINLIIFVYPWIKNKNINRNYDQSNEFQVVSQC